MTQEEHNIQAACVRWFGYAHPELRGLLFAVPNGSYRNKATAGRLKAEGVVAGVADLILLVPRCRASITENNAASIEIKHALCIEMKTSKGRQSPEQKEWQKKVEDQGYRYSVCRSLDEFIDTVEAYLR